MDDENIAATESIEMYYADKVKLMATVNETYEEDSSILHHEVSMLQRSLLPAVRSHLSVLVRAYMFFNTP